MNRQIAGVDEAGRGPLAGPVVVSAVILDADQPIAGLNDSKKLSEARRERLYDLIISRSKAYQVVEIHPDLIDQLNILQATMLGMKRAVESLQLTPDQVLIDGNRTPELKLPATAIVGGDGLEPAISAASILAKVSRDRYMLQQHRQYPEYGFDRHKGYPTPEHLSALRQHGPCPLHRRSFAPVRACMQAGLGLV